MRLVHVWLLPLDYLCGILYNDQHNKDPMAKKKALQILLVEDDAFLANIYKTKFEMEGFKVTVAENGELGLKEANKKRPDLVLLDIL